MVVTVSDDDAVLIIGGGCAGITIAVQLVYAIGQEEESYNIVASVDAQPVARIAPVIG